MEKRRRAEPSPVTHRERREIVPSNHILSDSEIDDDGMLLAYMYLRCDLLAVVVAVR